MEGKDNSQQQGNLPEKGKPTDAIPPAVLAQAEAAAAANTSPAQNQGSGPGNNLQVPSQQGTKAPSAKTAAKASTQTLGDSKSEFDINHDGMDTNVNISTDGRVNININQRSRRLSNVLVPALTHLTEHKGEAEPDLPPAYIPPGLGALPGQKPPPKLNIVIQIVGSRGDVQPFIALGKVLKDTYGHRIRVATHPTFKTFVEENGLEFFSIGGDPAELMAFMVKNPGLLPGMDSLKSGDVGKRRKGIYEILQGCWRSCIESGDGCGSRSSIDLSEDSTSFDSGISLNSHIGSYPFIADAIIANPPSFAHIHIAEKMGIPLHMMFTMPWTPTQSFPHPLANIQSSNADTSLTNFMSYALVDLMTWQGLGDLINKFREKTLQLEPMTLIWAPGTMTRLKIPYTYCWSPALIPKPKDWGNYISICGFYFLQLASSYTPDPELAAFLDAGPPPVYIGFGSIVIDDPNAMTKMIFEAVKKTGIRALVSKGWGGLGAEELGVPEGVFMLGNVPHDWLFQRVSAVVHHGGAGTTAAGIAAGKPTVVVPFFGDQPFWGAMTARAGAGPMPIPYSKLDADSLAAQIKEALKPSALEKAKALGQSIAAEKGADIGARDFHTQLKIDELRCTLAPSRVAVWRVKRTKVKLSALAATVLGNEGLLDFGDLKLYRPREYEVEQGPWDPITGGASALVSTMASLMMGFADFPVEILKLLRDKNNDLEKEKSSHSSPSGTPHLEHKDSNPFCPFPHRHSSTSLFSSKSAKSPPRTPSVPASGAASPALEHETSHTSIASTVIDEPLSTQETATPGSGVSRTNSSSMNRTESVPLEAYLGAGKGASRIVGTALKSPLDFTLSLAKGFHNAPKLYGDQTVRHTDKVTDFQSGVRAAGKEFGYGFYDGISGLVTQPVKGAQQEGVAGLIKGIGKGIGGVVLKPGAAIWGLPGYTFQGIYQEIQNHLGSSAQNYVIAARTAQGYEDWKTSTPEERMDIVQRWHAEKVHVRREKRSTSTVITEGEEPLHGFKATRHLSFDERKKLKKEHKKWKLAQKEKSKHKPSIHIDPLSNPVTSRTMSADSINSDNEQALSEEFESAIQRSITATSRGDAAQDQMIERAIRATVHELRRTHTGDPSQQEQSLDQALRKGVSEVHRHDAKAEKPSISSSSSGVATPRKSTSSTPDAAQAERDALHKALRADLESQHLEDADTESDDDEHDEAFQKALTESKRHYAEELARGNDDDAELKRALEESKHDDELRRAIEESMKLHGTKEEKGVAKGEKLERERTEEEIVLEYVKKQSLAEAEARSKIAGSSEAEVKK